MHNDRPNYENGLCETCYIFVNKKPEAVISQMNDFEDLNEDHNLLVNARNLKCKHFNLPHFSEGLCKKCYKLEKIH